MIVIACRTQYMETGGDEWIQGSNHPGHVNAQSRYAIRESTRSVATLQLYSRNVLTFLSHLAFAFAQLLHAMGVLPLFSILCEEWHQCRLWEDKQYLHYSIPGINGCQEETWQIGDRGGSGRRAYHWARRHQGSLLW